MPHLFLHFWDRLSLMVRLLLVLVLCLLITTVVAAYQSARDTALMVQHTIESELRYQMDIIESSAKAAINYNKGNSDPMINLKNVFEGAEYSPEMVQASFRDTSDSVSINYDKPLPLRAPNWFAQRCGLEEFSANRALVIDGLYYGVLTLKISPNDAINKAWGHYLLQMRLLLVIFVLVWLSVSWVLHQGLQPLKSLARAYDALGRGELSTRLEVRGSPELRTSLSNFNEMALKIEASRNQISASEERFRVLFEHAPDAIVVHDFDLNRFVDANASAEALFGYPREELLKMEPRCFFPADQTERLEVFETFLRQSGCAPREEKIAAELELLNAKGVKRTCSVHLVMLPDENKKLIRASFIDITERKRAEEALRLQSMIVANIDEGINLVRASDGEIVYANNALERMFGYGPDELIGKNISLLNAPTKEQSPLEMAQMIMEPLRVDGKWTGEVRNVRKDGRLFWSFASVSQFDHAEFGTVWLTVQMDITEQRRMEEEREKLQAQLQQALKMEAVGTLAGGIAHDFNNILQAINGYTQLLLMDKPSSDQEYNSLKAIQDAGLRASDLVRQLLLFSRKVDSKKLPLELQHEVEQAQKLLERTIPKMVEINLLFGTRLWTVNADPVQMEQMLLNLGTNAADAMPDGGKLLFRIENTILDDDYTTRHLGAQPGKYVVLTVSDTGHGMDQETVSKIFEPFFTTKEFGKGTGLGLASSYGIVKSHGGYITCHSEVGRGTTFQIYFPAIDQPEVHDTKVLESKLILRGTENVLLVDDEDAIRRMAQMALIKFGYKVRTASSGEEAIGLFKDRDEKIDLVIMDLGMPGMGGYKCLQELIRLDPAVKVIIASGYSIDGQVTKSMDAGAKGYVGKPYQLADLLHTVREVLDSTIQVFKSLRRLQLIEASIHRFLLVAPVTLFSFSR